MLTTEQIIEDHIRKLQEIDDAAADAMRENFQKNSENIKIRGSRFVTVLTSLFGLQ